MGLFVATRLVAYGLGLRFDLSPLQGYWQLIDVELLRTDLLRSLVYLHAQPPLFNLVVGSAVKLSATWLFPVLYLGLALAFQLALYGLLVDLGVGPWGAVGIAAWLGARPGMLLVESWLMYDLPVIFLLTASAWSLSHSFSRRGASAGRFRHLTAWLLGALVLTRALFHGVFLLAAALGLAWISARWTPKEERSAVSLDRRWLVAFALPLALVAGLYVKNAWIFGEPGASSWFGMNFARVVRAGVDENQLERATRRGDVPEILGEEPFGRLDDYAEWVEVRVPEEFAHVPLLAEEAKSTGARNFHHAGWIAVGDAYAQAAERAVRAFPSAWPVGFAKAVFYWLQPVGEMPHLWRRVQAIEGLGGYFALGRALSFPVELQLSGKPREVYLTFLLTVPLGMAASAWLAWSTWRRDDPRWPVALFLFGTTAYVFAVGCAFEVGENARFRSYVDPLWVAAVAALVVRRPGPRGAIRGVTDDSCGNSRGRVTGGVTDDSSGAESRALDVGRERR